MDDNSVPLVSTLKMVAVTSMVTFLDKYPELKGLLNSGKYSDPYEAWDYFITVAGVGLYLLTRKISAKESRKITNELAEFDKKGVQGLENFMDFMEIDKKNEVDYRARAGVWVLWNLKGEFPTNEEADRLAPAIGSFLGILAS